MEVVSRSIPGRRSQNEDAAFCWSGDAGGAACAIIVVADGMGGHRGGQEASRLAIEAIEDAWAELLDEASGEPPEADRAWLEMLIRKASEAVRRYQEGQEELSGMGTTLTLACMCGGRAIFANVGDSRTYLVTESEILQVTEDHSAVAEAIRKEKITEEEARQLPYRDALTRSIGGGDSPPEPDLFPPLEVETWNGHPVANGGLVVPEDCFLLSCSDGLIKEVTDIEIYECFRHTSSLEEGARQLVLTAYQKGSTDNVTVAALERGRVRRLKPYRSGGPLPEEATRPAEATPPNGSPGAGGREESNRVLWFLLIGLMALLLLLGAAYAWRAYDLPLQIPADLGSPAGLLPIFGVGQARSFRLSADIPFTDGWPDRPETQ